MATGCPVCPWEVLRLTHQQAIGGRDRTPQCSTGGAQVRAVLGLVTERQPALPVSIIHGARQGLGQNLGLLGLVEEALAVAVIQEGGDHQGTARGPGPQLVQVREGGRHHVRAPVVTVDAGTLLGIVVGHVENMTCRRGTLRKKESVLYINRYRSKCLHSLCSKCNLYMLTKLCECLTVLVAESIFASVPLTKFVCHSEGRL